MNILKVIIFSLLVNSDSILIGLSYGVKKIKISTGINILIGFITAIGTIGAMIVGELLTSKLSYDVGSIVGGIMIILLGIYSLIKAILNKQEVELLKNPEKADVDKSGYIDFKEALALSVALSLNNCGLGLAFATYVNFEGVLLTTLLVFIFSCLGIFVGIKFGNKIGNRFNYKVSEILGSILIIALGISNFIF